MAETLIDTDFKPSDVVLVGVPLCGTFGKAEAEHAAALLVRTAQVNGDDWNAPIPAPLVGSTIKADIAAGREPWVSLNTNPFFRPNFCELIGRGFARWAEPQKSIAWTPEGVERLRRWVAAPRAPGGSDG